MMHDEIAAAIDWWTDQLASPKPHLHPLSEPVIIHFKTALRTRIQQAFVNRTHLILTATQVDPKSPLRLAAHDAGIADAVLRFPSRPFMTVTHNQVVVNEGHGNHLIYPRLTCVSQERTPASSSP